MDVYRARRAAGAGLAAAVMLACQVSPALSQMPPGEPISLPNHLTMVIVNPVNTPRPGEFVAVPLTRILEKAPDFNRSFFRVKYPTVGFEPLDIPSQIVRVPGDSEGEALVFQVDLAPRERKTVVLQYNPSGSGLPAYPVKTQVFEKWYTDGSNIAWESEVIAYRSYSGLIDYFGKSFPHLRLQSLPPDSYHHETAWGVDPFVIGKKPGLCGVALVEGNTFTPCWGTGDSLAYTHRGFGGGPVCAGAIIGVVKNGEPLLDEYYTIHGDRHENVVRTVVHRKGVLVAPGMQKNNGEMVKLDEKRGFLVSQARAGEYGTIGMALVFRPGSYAGMVDREEGRFIKLKPDPDGSVSYLSMGVWYRVSADQPASILPRVYTHTLGPQDALVQTVERLALCFMNPVTVDIVK